MRDEIQKEISVIRREAEADLGHPLPAEVWAIIEEEERLTYSPGQFDGDPDEASEFLSEYRAVVGRHVAVLSHAVPVMARQLGLPSNSTADKPERPRKLSRRPFERRLYLFDFIIQAKGEGITDRADWTAIADEWNRTHPHDPKSPRNLKSRFWEMKHDEELTDAWVAMTLERSMPEIRAGFERARELVREMPSRLAEYQKQFQAQIAKMRQKRPEARTLNDLVEIEREVTE